MYDYTINYYQDELGTSVYSFTDELNGQTPLSVMKNICQSFDPHEEVDCTEVGNTVVGANNLYSVLKVSHYPDTDGAFVVGEMVVFTDTKYTRFILNTYEEIDSIGEGIEWEIFELLINSVEYFDTAAG